MSQALHRFHFLQPWWLLGLLILPPLLWLVARGFGGQRSLARLVDPILLPHLLHGREGIQRMAWGLLVPGWLLLVLALAGPTWSRMAQPMYARQPVQVVALSLSRHMLARDVKPDRIMRARYKVHDLLNANRDGLNALIGYAGESFVVAPLTSDAHSLFELLDAMAPNTMPVDGNNAAQAIQQAVALIHKIKGQGVLVLITDSVNKAAQVAARQALTEGVQVSVLGIGTPQGAPVPLANGGFLRNEQGQLVRVGRDDAGLATLAAVGGGRYVAMTGDDSDIRALRSTWAENNDHTSVVAGRQGDVWRDRGPWLLLPLLWIVAAGFRRGWLLVFPFLVLPLMTSPMVHASGVFAHGWHDWWRRPDQQAFSALRAGHPGQAGQLARDLALRGVAAYRAGDYVTAVQIWRQLPGTDAAYNLGNSLARLGRFPEAIHAYDRALTLDQHNEDARANRKVVEQVMRRQKKPQLPSKSLSKQHSDHKNTDSRQRKDSGAKAGNHKPSNPHRRNGKEHREKNQRAKGSASSHTTATSRMDRSASRASSPSSSSGTIGNGSQSAMDKAQNTVSSHSPQQLAVEKNRLVKAEQALRKQMNQALPHHGKSGTRPLPTYQLGAESTHDPWAKLPTRVRQALQQVQDDPGALLRRKFRLEYLERHQRSGMEGGSP